MDKLTETVSNLGLADADEIAAREQLAMKAINSLETITFDVNRQNFIQLIASRNKLIQRLHIERARTGSAELCYQSLKASHLFATDTPYFYLFPLLSDKTEFGTSSRIVEESTPKNVMDIYTKRWKTVVTSGSPEYYLSLILYLINFYIEKQISQNVDVESFHIGVTSAKKCEVESDDTAKSLEVFTSGFLNRMKKTYAKHGYTHMICLNALQYDPSYSPYPYTENLRLEQSLFNYYSGLNGDKPSSKFQESLPKKSKKANKVTNENLTTFWKPGNAVSGKEEDFYFFLYAAVKLTETAAAKVPELSIQPIVISDHPADSSRKLLTVYFPAKTYKCSFPIVVGGKRVECGALYKVPKGGGVSRPLLTHLENRHLCDIKEELYTCINCKPETKLRSAERSKHVCASASQILI